MISTLFASCRSLPLVSTRSVLLAAALIVLAPAPVAAQMDAPATLQPLHFRHIGPIGNRVAAVAGVEGDAHVYYVGAASGGIWKTEDGGLTWRPLFDDYPVHAIGSLAVATSDPQIVWAGTGEPHIRSNVSIGNGVWKSTDGGDTWRHMGLDATGRISDVLIHPRNPDIVYVAALGHGHSPQPERGIFRTTDGGTTWEQVLFVDENTGASDLEMDPNNPRILFAGMWHVSINTWNRGSGGPGGGIFVSRDGGDTWTKLQGHGLPTRPVGKVDVCMTAADARRVYALIETGDGVPWHGEETDSGELWRSDDGGHNWQLVNHSQDLAGRSAYYTVCHVSPDDADEAYFLAAPMTYTFDGGHTYDTAGSEGAAMARPGGDNHDMWIDPGNPDRMIIANDPGVAISTNRGRSWMRIQLPIAQMYHVTADNNVPYYVYGNRQDGPSFRGPSNSRTGGFGGGSISRGMWHAVGGGESGFATPDPDDPDLIWSSASGAGARGGIVVRYRERTRQFRQVEVWPESTGGWPAEELKYRFQWTFPLLISPHDNDTVYVTSQHVHRTTDDGQSWEVISPDLTTNDKSKQGISGGLTPDNIGVEYCCVIYAFDESPAQQGVLWAGTNDGLVQISRDGGSSWNNVTANIPGLPPDGVVRAVEASKWEAGKAYLAIEHHQVGDFAPYVYRTSDFGRSWDKITDGLAPGVLSFARHIEEDPVRPGLLYLGTENALYVSFDDGDSWQSMMTDLPASPVYGITIQEHFNDLVVGTYGRGFWIMDDLSPLQQLTPEMVVAVQGGGGGGATAHLFEPRSAYRFHNITSPATTAGDPSAGENPPRGASISYWLGQEQEQEQEVSVRISDAAGQTVRVLTGTKTAGINRIWWDLRGESATPLRLRTRPVTAEWVDLGADRVREVNSRPGILQPPGRYTVTLEAAGRTLEQPLEVIKDPNSEGTETDIASQIAMVAQLYDDLETTVGMINRIEWMRRQLYDLQAVLADTADSERLIEAAGELDGTLLAVEEDLYQTRLTYTGQDRVRWPTRLFGHFQYLAGAVSTVDFPPTDQAREVQQVLEDRMHDLSDELARLIEQDVEAFNELLRERGLGPVVTGVE
ncbi:MAG TPA: sialidase [Acidobacteriota bacterium]|nr:sialidase [Acidobacteriota bacterium]